MVVSGGSPGRCEDLGKRAVDVPTMLVKDVDPITSPPTSCVHIRITRWRVPW